MMTSGTHIMSCDGSNLTMSRWPGGYSKPCSFSLAYAADWMLLNWTEATPCGSGQSRVRGQDVTEGHAVRRLRAQQIPNKIAETAIGQIR